jgi:hypothetical protein
MRGIERGCLERLFEAVHVDQDVASAAGLREKIAENNMRPETNVIRTIGAPVLEPWSFEPPSSAGMFFQCTRWRSKRGNLGFPDDPQRNAAEV